MYLPVAPSWIPLFTSVHPWGEQLGSATCSPPWCSVSAQAEGAKWPWTETFEVVSQNKSFLFLKLLPQVFVTVMKSLTNTKRFQYVVQFPKVSVSRDWPQKELVLGRNGPALSSDAMLGSVTSSGSTSSVRTPGQTTQWDDWGWGQMYHFWEMKSAQHNSTVATTSEQGMWLKKKRNISSRWRAQFIKRN
jgi:hypothetical protein